MSKDFNSRRPSGSRKMNEPEVANLYPNTELGIDLKLVTRKPGCMPLGTYLDGIITHDKEDHFTFVQNAEKKSKGDHRNPHVYQGSRVNVVKRQDGSLVPTFCYPRYAEDYTFQNFCIEAAQELLTIAGLLGKEEAEE